jgi:Flp pilus assembly protein TadB
MPFLAVGFLTSNLLSSSQPHLIRASGVELTLRVDTMRVWVARAGRSSMDVSENSGDKDPGHGWLYMVVGCLLLVAGLVVLASFGVSWGVGLILVAFIVCPLALLMATRATRSHH